VLPWEERQGGENRWGGGLGEKIMGEGVIRKTLFVLMCKRNGVVNALKCNDKKLLVSSRQNTGG